MREIKKTKRRRGGSTVVMIGIAGVILLFGLFFLELLEMYNYQYAIEVRAQRAINSTVEYAMDDTMRADGFNYMSINDAQEIYLDYLREDLKVDSNGHCKTNGKTLYTVAFGPPVFDQINSIYAKGMSIEITVKMTAGLGAAFGMDGYTWKNTFSSTNFRTDDNERAGWSG